MTLTVCMIRSHFDRMYTIIIVIDILGMIVQKTSKMDIDFITVKYNVYQNVSILII